MSSARAALLVVCAILLAPPLVFAAWLCFVWPPPSWWRSHWPARTAFQQLRALQYAAGDESPPLRYQPVPLDSISDLLRRAVTTSEDDAFYEHDGLDYRAIREALGYRRRDFFWRDARDRTELLRVLSEARRRPEALRGASTITQQLAKNLYLSPSRNPLRKLKEAVIAWRLEWSLSKERILELYLNVVELGPNTWGAEAASRRYFNRGAARLTLEQAALLAGTLPHPLSSNPSYRPGRARYRQQLILRRLRGEPVQLPLEAEDELPPVQSSDTLAVTDSVPAPDSTGPARDTIMPLPPDTTRKDPKP
jgi:monofunctional biosynthetic peptidoglycan transglycosylase